MGHGCSQPGTSAGCGGLAGGPQGWELGQWVVYGAQSPGPALLSAAKFRFGAVPSFLAAVGTSWTCCLCLPSPAQIQGAQGSLKAAGCREPEHRAQGWGWEHGGEGEGCPSHLSKSMLGLSRSKCFLHLCWHSSGAGEPFSGAGPPPGFLWDAPARMQQPQGRQSIPKRLGTAWRELVAAKPSRKAWQERDWQAQGDVSFPICLALAPQGFAPLGRIYVGQGPSSGRAVALTSALNRESHSLGASPCESGHCRGFSTAAGNF